MGPTHSFGKGRAPGPPGRNIWACSHHTVDPGPFGLGQYGRDPYTYLSEGLRVF